MIELLIMIYAAILWVVFKVFKVPVNKWSITTSVLGGFFGIGLLMLVMNYFQPYSREARLYYYTTPIYTQVDGRVLEVPVQSNTPLKKGDVLFRLDPRPFEYRVENLKGELEKLEAERDRGKEEFDRSLQVFREGGGSEREVQSWRIKHETTIADIEALEAQLKRALLDLEVEAVVRAPTDGYVTQMFLRPGMTLVADRQTIAGMTFVHAEEKNLVAAFSQNGMQNIKAGHEAEITFDAIPGRAFKGRVEQVITTVAQGQILPSRTGELVFFENVAQLSKQGRVPVKIEVLDDLSGFQIPAGAKAEVAIYSGRWQIFAIVRRILLRMKSWQKYVFGG